MRILMAVPLYPFPVAGGLERQAHVLSSTLVDRGHQVHALSTRFDKSQKDSDTIDGVRVHRVRWVDFKPVRFLLFPFSLVNLAGWMFRESRNTGRGLFLSAIVSAGRPISINASLGNAQAMWS